MEGGEGGAGEVRKVHVVYFLSRNGEMEQPHLIRVRQRTHRDGVRLRDVKRWLSELRGKGMPDSFAWSYKRRYRTGYVWQDVADDDLITPVSDNEYVLKGSLTTTATPAAAPTRPASSSSTVFFSPSAATSDSASAGPAAADPIPRGDPKHARPPETPTAEKPDAHEEVSPKPPPPEDAEEEEKPPRQPSEASAQTTRRQGGPAASGSPLPVSNGGSCEIEEEAQTEGSGGEEKKGAPASDSCHSLLPGRRRGYAWCGGGGGSAFRSLLGCGAGAAEVDDAALLPVEPQRRGQLAAGVGESRGGGISGSRNRAGEAAAAEQKTAAVRSEACKPAREPRCSQCGRPFRPERLHAHMKSCRALKSQRKNISSGKLPKESESNRAMLAEEASSLFLLSH